MRKRIFGLLGVTCSSVALAGTPGWKISETSGPVQVSHNGMVRVATRSAAVEAGDTVTTGRGGRAVLVRGSEFVMVAPASQLRLPADDQATGFTRVLQDFGSVVFMIKKKMTPHFEVKTPYLAAVVKGTTFTVAVTPKGASVQVLEGAVDVATVDGGAHDLITPGAVALVGANNRFQLQVAGETGKRVIDSPAGPGPAEQGAGQATAAAPAEEAVVSDQVAPVQDVVSVTTAVYAEPVSLSDLTGGLVSGMAGSDGSRDMANVAVATKMANEASTSVVKALEVAQVTGVAIESQVAANVIAAKEEQTIKDTVAAQAATNQAELDAQAAAQAAEQAAMEKVRIDAANAAANVAADEAARSAVAAAAEAAQAQADASAKIAARADAEAAAVVAAQTAEAIIAAAAEAAARAEHEAEGPARDAAVQAAAQAARDAEKALRDAAKAAEQATRARDDAARSASDKAAKDAAKAAQDAAADKAIKEAAKTAEDARKAGNDKAARDAEKAAKGAEKDAAKQAADAAKANEIAAKDAKKAADELAKASAKAAEDALKSRGKEAEEAAKAIQNAQDGKKD
ncbi:hypothetical protein C1T17_02240 [Sphingobium sp. SCG-1]|uniref:FecR family protein n=1 Tax=Sphingobium sp. SCG-1 TaxID=2072936 RepID=UPI000CD67B84|nr:FecR family protein [Sphingobium sp. SCG-1]AUW57076.1 hypothetical protein C1T17_02240 [Sphingobium sp. SCG-1]